MDYYRNFVYHTSRFKVDNHDRRALTVDQQLLARGIDWLSKDWGGDDKAVGVVKLLSTGIPLVVWISPTTPRRRSDLHFLFWPPSRGGHRPVNVAYWWQEHSWLTYTFFSLSSPLKTPSPHLPRARAIYAYCYCSRVSVHASAIFREVSSVHLCIRLTLGDSPASTRQYLSILDTFAEIYIDTCK